MFHSPLGQPTNKNAIAPVDKLHMICMQISGSDKNENNGRSIWWRDHHIRVEVRNR